MKKTDYKGSTIYMGLDVHLKSWDLKVVTDYTTPHRTVHISPASIDQLVNYMHTYYPNGNYQCVYEAGFSGFWIQKDLEKRGISTMVVHAADVPTTDKEKRTKTDKIDATKLAKCLRAGMLTGVYIPSDEQEKDRLIVRLRYKRASEVRATKNRIKSILRYFGYHREIDGEFVDRYWSNRMIERIEILAIQHEAQGLSEELASLRIKRQLELATLRQIRALSKMEKYQQRVSWLMSIKGVGLLTAMVFLTEIGPIDRFKKLDKLMSYIGLVPGSHSSGENEKGTYIIKRGNKQIRTSVILAAWSAIRSDPELAACYESYRKRGMPSQKAIIKIARKLVNRMMFVLKNEKKMEY